METLFIVDASISKATDISTHTKLLDLWKVTMLTIYFAREVLVA